MDELWHFVQKKGFQFEYGRPSIDKTKDLLILPSETEPKTLSIFS
jgi:hypothetical protein